ncbi:hypothetical protein MtrunA17_Chr3g0114661 [Medicago truncatula]|uniref:Transmembrane protein n=1 Tax=Medicago truncatula TaxID=3880 RepID=A0A396IV46_MEDTR|nr:hypothetical protein MtrunA17_Chr3g0114661 [Medicago truncatula]
MNLNKFIFGLIKCLQWCCLDSLLQRTLAFMASSTLDHNDLFLWLETGFQKTYFNRISRSTHIANLLLITLKMGSTQRFGLNSIVMPWERGGYM